MQMYRRRGSMTGEKLGLRTADFSCEVLSGVSRTGIQGRGEDLGADLHGNSAQKSGRGTNAARAASMELATSTS